MIRYPFRLPSKCVKCTARNMAPVNVSGMFCLYSPMATDWNLNKYYFLFFSIHSTAKSTNSRCLIIFYSVSPIFVLLTVCTASKSAPISKKSSPSTNSVSYAFQTRFPFSMTALCSTQVCFPGYSARTSAR